MRKSVIKDGLVTSEFIIRKLPWPLLAKEGDYLPEAVLNQAQGQRVRIWPCKGVIGTGMLAEKT
jgi:hypothetical protein